MDEIFLAMKKTQEALTKISAPYPRLAQFRCTLVLAWPDGHDEIFEGTSWSSCLAPEGLDVMGTILYFNLAAMNYLRRDELENKNKISHRSIAFDKLVRACFE